jgi:hypothetical protein
MKFNSILNNFESTSLRNYYLFEAYIIALLKYHLDQQGKELLSASRDFGYDALAPEGMDDLIGKTVVEIKSSRNPRLLLHHLGKIGSRISQDFDNYLLIYGGIIPEELKEKVISKGNENFQGKKFVLWDSSNIEKLENKYEDISNEALSNLSLLRIEKSLENKPLDWMEERKQRLELLAKQYEKGGISFVLGAGVSIDAGLPSWNDLLKSLYSRHLKEIVFKQQDISLSDINNLVRVLEKIESNSALTAARYIRKGLGKDSEGKDKFIAIVKESLYQNFSMDQNNSNLLNTLSDLCIPKRTGAKIDSIITYNFDDLLEKKFDNKILPYRCIYRDGDSATNDELPIYHVHGFLPEDPSKYQNLGESLLIFSEENYHEVFSDPYHWSNLVQLTNFREKNCVMIGLSMTDPNLRRLLEIAARRFNESKHFVFMQRASIKKITSLIEKDKPVIEEGIINQFNINHHTLYEAILQELGISIIWYEDYKEIPDLLRTIN